MSSKSVVVLSGAGISAESGIKTFRDADGLWEGHDVMEVASPQGWRANQELVLKFYLHLHGELLKARSTRNENDVKEWKTDINTGDLCELGAQLRPHIVWFGEAVPLLDTAANLVTYLFCRPKTDDHTQ